MITSFSQCTPIKVKKIPAAIPGKVKKTEAQTKSGFLIKKCVCKKKGLICLKVKSTYIWIDILVQLQSVSTISYSK